MITKALILGTSIFAGSVAGAVYDAMGELFPGRIMPLSHVNRTVALWDTATAGREPKWINSDLKLETYVNPMGRSGHFHFQSNCPGSINMKLRQEVAADYKVSAGGS
jgi:hypothetical protein